jgi:hypothetical protein
MTQPSINEPLWSDPEAYYDGPVDADLTATVRPFEAATAIFAFATEAQTSNRTAMRQRWPEYRGKVPADLARIIIDENEGAACS